MPDFGNTPDAVLRLLLPSLLGLGYLLQQLGVPERAVSLVLQVAFLGLYAGVVALLVRIRRRADDRRVAALLAAVAVGLAVWIVRHPATGFETSLVRSDHLVFAGCGGAALRLLPARLRMGILTALSLGILLSIGGPIPVGVVLTGMACGVAGQRLSATRGARDAALVQALLMTVTLGACALAWNARPDLGLGAQGLFAFMLMRHVSWVVDVRRGAGGTLLDYWWYQLFYPCCYAATERYADFRARNPEPGALVDDQRLFWCAMRSAVYVSLGLMIPVETALGGLLPAPVRLDLTGLLDTPSRLSFAVGYLLLFVRSALYLMGVWSMLEAIALAWGMRIHPNFAGILAARSPSQFWYAWRGTMTRWLVEYVYIPLGGNRARQTRNVFAVFAVSGAWHCMGIPFLKNTASPEQFVPVVTWAVVNAVVLSAALAWRQQPQPAWMATVPASIRAGAARLGTWIFGGVTVTFLAFNGDLVARFPEFLLRLVGVR